MSEPSSTATSDAGPAQVLGMIALLADESPPVVAACRRALLAQGQRAVPLLTEALASVAGRHERRVRAVLADVRFPDADEAFLAHLAEGAELERGALLLARLVDGGPEPDAVGPMLDRLADEVRARLPSDAEPEEGLDALRAVLVDEHRISGVPPEHAVPVDALLHGVLTGRGGMPLPLCMTWMLVARRSGVPLVGVNMPGHFLMRLDVPGEPVILDAFRGGMVLPLATCAQWLERLQQHGLSVDQLGCDDAAMLLRTVRNLVALAQQDDDARLAARGAALLVAASQRLGR